MGWTKAKNRWKRRAAALVPSARRGLHTREIYRIAAPLLSDDDGMARKGVGRLVLRYAAEKMTARDRARVLG